MVDANEEIDPNCEIDEGCETARSTRLTRTRLKGGCLRIFEALY